MLFDFFKKGRTDRPSTHRNRKRPQARPRAIDPIEALESRLAPAAVYTWNGSLSNDWLTPGNWTSTGTDTGGANNLPDGAGDSVVFDAALTANLTLTAPITLDAITVSAGAYSVSGSTISGAINVDVAGSLGFTINSTITGTSSITKANGGSLTLGGANDYTGATSISAGTLIATSATALGGTSTGTTVASGATLEVGGSGLTIAEPLVLNGTGVSSAGAVNNTGGSNTLSGAITLGSAATINNPTAANTLNVTGVVSLGGTLTVDGAGATNVSNTVQNAVGSAYPGTVLADSPIAYYRFEDTAGSGTIADSAVAPTNPGTNNGVTLGGAAGGLSSLTNYGAFNGTASNVRVPNTTEFSTLTNYSFETWFYPTGTARGDIFTYKGGIDFGIHWSSNGAQTVSLYHNGFVITSPGLTSLNTWHHLVVTRNGTAATMYIDGAAVGTGTDAQSMASTNDALIGSNHGGNPSAPSTFFNGRLDEFAIYSTALSAAQVSAHNAAGQVVLSGSGIVKTNSGTLTLSGTNTFGGPGSSVAINGGVVSVASDASLGSGANTVSITNNATLRLGNGFTSVRTFAPGTGGGSIDVPTGTATVNGPTLNGTGLFTKTGAGVLSITGGTTNLTGGHAINGGTLQVAASARLDGGDITVNSGGTLQVLTGGGDSIGNTRNITVNSGGVFDFQQATAEVFNILTLNGAGTGAGAFINSVGSTTASITPNTLTLGSATTIGGAGNLTLNRLIGGTGNLTKAGAGIVTQTTGVSNFAGTATISGGMFIISGSRLDNGNITVNSGATLRVLTGGGDSIGNTRSVVIDAGGVFDFQQATNETFAGLTISGTGISGNGALINSSVTSAAFTAPVTLVGDVTVGAGNLTVSSAIGETGGARALTKIGTGTLILAGNNTYTGTTTISAGVLQIGAGGTSGALGGNGPVVDNASLVFNRSDAALIFSNAISGSGTVTQAGSGTTMITGNNSYTTTTINNGILQIGNNGTTGTLGSGNVTINGGFLAFNRPDTVALGLALSGAGGFIQGGTGTVQLTNGSNSYAGTTLVSRGILQPTVNGALGSTTGATLVSPGGTLQLAGLNYSSAEPLTIAGAGAGSVGALNSTGGNSTYAGPVTVVNGSIGNSTAGTTLSVSGAVTLGGTITVTGAGDTSFAGAINETADYASNVLASAPIAYYRLNETVGLTAADSAVAPTNDGTSTGVALGAAAASSKLGVAAAFDGTTSNVRITNSTEFSTLTDYTFETWFFPSAAGRGDMFTYKGGAVDFGLHWASQTALRPTLYHGGFILTSNTDAALNTWHHLVVTRTGTAVVMYQDGVQVGTATDTGSMASTLDPLIGANHTGSPATVANVFNGRLDEFAIYNRALTAAEATQHYVAGLSGSIVKSGTGTATLGAASNLTGTTTISGGVLKVAANNALGTSAGGTTVASGATLQFSGVNYSTAEPVTASGTGVGGIGAISNTGGDSTFAGVVTVQASATIGNVTAGSTLTLSSAIDNTSATLTVDGAGNVNLAGGISESTYASSVLASGPRAYYRFEETSGTTTADSGSLAPNNPGTSTGMGFAQTAAFPKLGVAGGFNGTSTNVRITNDPEFSTLTNYTFETWFFPTGTARGDIFTYKDGTSDFGIHWSSQTAQRVSLYHNGFITTASANVSLNAWHHLVVTRSGSAATMYIDGAVAGTGTDNTTMANTNDLLIGSNHSGTPSSPGTFFAGRLDEFAIYNRALSASEVAGHLAAASAQPVTKNGSGTLTIGVSTYGGTTTVNQGLLKFSGATSSNIVVNAGAVLGGTGPISGLITTNGTGTVNPGNSPGILVVNGNYSANSTFEINSPYAVAGTDYDQIQVNGAANSVNLSGATLTFLGTGSFPAGSAVILIQNNTSNPTIPSGSLPEGSLVTIGTGQGRILYNSGDGNDVVVVSTAAPTTIYIDDNFSGGVGSPIADADAGTTGNQPASFGVNAFTSIGAAQSAHPAFAGTFIVNDGTYAAATLSGTQSITVTGPDAAQNAIFAALTTAAGQTITIQGTSTLTVGDATNSSLQGNISGSGGLTKQGSGTLTVGGDNSYTGPTNVNAGILRVASVIPNLVAKYEFEGNANDTSGSGFNGTLNGAGSSYTAGQFGQSLNFTGSQTVTVPFNAAFGMNSFTVSAWVNLNTAPGVFGILGTRIGGDTTFDVKVQAANVHGDVGTGSAWINTAVDFNQVVPPGSWHMITYVIDDVAKQFRLYYDGTLKNTIAYTGTPLFMKPGQTLGIGTTTGGELMNGKIDDVNIFSRPITPAEIALLLAGGANGVPDTSAVTVASGATLDLNGKNEVIGSLAGVAGSTVTLAGGTLNTGGNGAGTTFAGTIGGAGSLTKSGGGTFILQGTNVTYTGTTTISGGILQLNDTTAFASAIVDNSILVINRTSGTQTFTAISGTGSVTSMGNTALVLQGPGVTYFGGTTINAGTLELNNIGSFNSSAISIGSTLTLNQTTGTGTVLAAISGAAVVNKIGAGTVVLGGSSGSTYTGLTTVSDGTLTLAKTSGNAIGGNLLLGDADAGVETLLMSGNNQIIDSATVTINNNGVFSAGTFSDTFAVLAGDGSITSPTFTGSFGLIPQTLFTNDAGTGIASTKNYTHALDFNHTASGGTAATVNGVAFTGAATSGTAGGYGWALNVSGSAANGATGATGGISTLLEDFWYNNAGTNPSTLQLTNLTPGAVYEARLYSRNWGGPRNQSVTFDFGSGPSAPYAFDQDGVGPNYIGFRYQAASTQLTITMTAVVPGTSFHWYGMTNELLGGSLTVGDGTNQTFTGSITGSIGLIKQGGGQLALQGAGIAHTGLTTVNAGTLRLDDATAFASPIVNNATTNINRTSGTQTLTAGISGPGTVNLIGPGAIVFQGPGFVYTGTTNINTGTLELNNIGTFSSAAVNNATTLILNQTTGSATVNSAIAGAGVVNKIGPGTVTLGGTGANTYGGLTTVADGTLALGKTGVNAIPGNIVVGDADAAVETLQMAGNNQIADSATLTLNANGVFAAGSFSDTIAVLAGNGSITSPTFTGSFGLIPQTFFTNDAGTGIASTKTYTHALDFNHTASGATAATVNGVAFTGAAPVGTAGGFGWNLNVAGSAASGTTGATGGISTLLEDFWYNPTTSNPSTLQLQNLTPGAVYEARLYSRVWGGPRNQSITFDAGAGPSTPYVFDQDNAGGPSYVGFRYQAVGTTMTINITAIAPGTNFHWYGMTNELLGGSLTVGDGTNQTFTGSITGSIGLVKQGSGQLALQGAGIAHTGLTTVNAGILRLDDTTAFASPIVNNATVNINRTSGTETMAAGISGAGTVNLIGPGTVAFTGPGFVHTGPTNINTGALELRDITTFVSPIAITTSLVLNQTTGASTVSSAISGGGTVTKIGAGTVTLAGSSTNTYSGLTTVSDGTLALGKTSGNAVGGSLLIGDADAAVETLQMAGNNQIADSATVTVAANGVFAMGTFTDTIAVLAGNGSITSPSFTGSFGLIPQTLFTNDAGTGIASTKTYTHALDFNHTASGGTAATVNGVAFTGAAPVGTAGGFGWNLNVSGSAANGATGATGGISTLLEDFWYNNVGSNPSVLQLDNLTPGAVYEVRLYSRNWGGPRNQSVTFDFGSGQSTPYAFDQDGVGPNYIGFRYQAAGTQLIIRMTAVVPGTSFHWYGMTNELLGGTLTVGDATNQTFTGSITGSVGIAKQGSGQLALQGAGIAHTGQTTISAGTLRLDDATSFVSPIIDNAALVINRTSGTQTLTSISGTGTVSTVGAGAVVFQGVGIRYTGATTIGGASLELQDVTAFASSTINDNTALILNASAGPMRIPSNITGPGTVTHTGTNTTTLSGNNTYNGATLVSTGTIKVDSNSAAPSVAHYRFEGDTSDSSGNGFNGTITAAGTSFVAGQFGQALNFTGSQYVAVPFNSAFGLNSFTVSAWVKLNAAPGAFGIVGTRIGGDTTFDVKVQAANIHGDVGTGSAWINTSVDFNQVVPVGQWHMITYVIDDTAKQFRLYYDGALRNTIGYAGTPLFMKPGQTLGIGSTTGGELMNGAIDDVYIIGSALSGAQVAALMIPPTSNGISDSSNVTVASGATLDVNSFTETIGSLAGPAGATVTLGTGALTTGANGASTTYSGSITGSGSLTKSGAGTFEVAGSGITYTGPTTVSAGTLQLTNLTGFVSPITDNANLIINQTAGSVTHTSIAGTGTVTKIGAGAAVLQGAGITYSGTTTISAGSLELNGATGFASGSVVDNAALVLNQASGSITYSPAISGAGTLDKIGAGTVTLAGSTGNTYSGLTTVSEGTLLLSKSSGNAIGGDLTIGDADAAVETVRLLANNQIVDTSTVTVNGTGVLDFNIWSDTIGGLNGSGSVLIPQLTYGLVPQTFFTTDAGTGISTSKTYTHLLDWASTVMGPGPGTVNGVAFTNATGVAGPNWTKVGATGVASDDNTGMTDNGGMRAILQDFYHGSAATSVNLSGLIPGVSYETRIYIRQWAGGAAIRTQNITYDEDGVGPAGATLSNFNEDGSATPSFIGYRFVATTTSLDINIAQAVGSTGPWHWYGLSNEVLPQTVSAMTLAGSGTYSFSGVISGGGSLTKQGTGTQSLGGANTYTGATTVSGGALRVNGSLANGPAANDVTVNSGGTLGGSGNIAGTVQVNSGGTVAPGNSVGTLSTAAVNFVAGSTFNVEVVGNNADLLNVTGTVTLGGSTLLVDPASTPIAFHVPYTIIANDGVDPVSGIFAGLPEGTQIGLFSGVPLFITYSGGDGNDVELTTGPVINGTPGNDVLVIRQKDAINVEYSFNGNPFTFADATALVTFNGQGGTDLLLVDLAPSFVFAGNVQFSAESLRIQGAGSGVASYQPQDANRIHAGTGFVNFSGSPTIDFVGLADASVVTTSGAHSLQNGTTTAVAGLTFPPGYSVVSQASLAVVGAPITTNFAGNTLTRVTTGFGAGDSITVAAAGATSSGALELTGVTIGGTGVLTATSLDATALDGINLSTNIASLSAQTFGDPASIVIAEADAIDLTNVETFGGSVTITAGGDINVGYVAALDSSISLQVTAGSGSILDLNDDPDADVRAAFGITLVAKGTGTIGTGSDALELDSYGVGVIDALSGQTDDQDIYLGVETGDVRILKLNAVTGGGLVPAGSSGNITLTTAGNVFMDSAAFGAGADIVGDAVLITSAGDLGTSDNPLELNAVTLATNSVTGGPLDGAQFLAEADSVASSSLNSGNSSVNLERLGSGAVYNFSGDTINDGARLNLADGVQVVLSNDETIGALGDYAGHVATAAFAEVLFAGRTLTTGGNGADTSYSGILTGAGGQLVKTGVGRFTEIDAGVNTYTGLTTVENGALVLAKTGGGNKAIVGAIMIGDSVGAIGSAVLEIAANEQIADAAGIQFTGIDGRLLSTAGTTETITTPTDFAGGDVKIAGLVITTNAYDQPTGTTTLNGGVLRVGPAGTLNSSLGTSSTPGGTLQGSGTIYTNILTSWGTIDPSSGVTDIDVGNRSPGRITIRGNLQMTASSTTNLDVAPTGSDQLNVGINPALALPAGSYTNLSNYDLDPYLRGDVPAVTEPGRRGVNDLYNINGTVRLNGTLNTRPIQGSTLTNNVTYGNSMNFVWRALNLPMGGFWGDLNPKGGNLSSVPSDFTTKNSLDVNGLPTTAMQFDPRFMGSGGQFNAVGQSVGYVVKFMGNDQAGLTAPAYSVGQAKGLTLTSLTSTATVDTAVKVTKQLWNAMKDSHTRVTLTVTNTGTAAVTGPIYVELVGIPAGATVFNAAGKRPSTGKPYLVVPAASLAAGAAVTMEVDLLTPVMLGKTAALTLQVLRGGMP